VSGAEPTIPIAYMHHERNGGNRAMPNEAP